MELSSLCSHNFAHHVIESVLENGNAKHKSQVVQELLKEPWKYATHKNSSYIVEKALRHCDPSEEKALIKALGQPHQIFDLARTQFGCYVARALLQDSHLMGSWIVFEFSMCNSCCKQVFDFQTGGQMHCKAGWTRKQL